MKRKLPATLCVAFALFSFLRASSQDFGFKTIDAGGEFQYYGKGYIAGLHLAYNFPIHHGIQLRIGYNSSNWKDKGKHDHEEGNGPGASLGYRYYFLVRPHGFFLGARVDWWSLTIDWTEGSSTGKSKVTALQPALELGYMFLINDQLFISPAIAAGAQSNIKTDGEATGDGFLFFSGISIGWKF